MPAFIINGLRIVNDKILPVHYVLQDPKGPHAEPDTSFVVRSDLDYLFYYYQQINKVWIRTRLSDGRDADSLDFHEIFFEKLDPIPMAMASSAVNRLLGEGLVGKNKKIEIYQQLLKATAEYDKILAEDKGILRDDLTKLPSDKAIELIELVGTERLRIICEQGLGVIFKGMPEDVSLALIEKLGNKGIEAVVTDEDMLFDAIDRITVPARHALVAHLGNEKLRFVVPNVETLMTVFRYFPSNSWTMLFTRLGTDHVRELFCERVQYYPGVAYALRWPDVDRDKIKFLTSLRSALGPGIFKLLITSSYGLREIFKVMPQHSHIALFRILGGNCIAEMLKDPQDLSLMLENLSAPAGAELKVLLAQASTQNLPTQATSFVAYQNNNNNNTVTHETQVVNENTEQLTM